MVEINGEPWFVAKDVCSALGLALHNGSVSHHLRALDAAEISSMSNVEVTIPGIGMAHAKLVSESGLYKLVMRSDKPLAKPFQDWVTQEVLPSIRKTGMYVAGEETLDLTTDEGLMAMSLKVQAAMTAKLAQAMAKTAQP